jgi:hypothetical protein
VTTEKVEQQTQETDEVSQDQQGLDTEQADSGTPATATTQEVETLRGEIAKLQGDLRGLQGKQDRALNAIRRDTEAQARQRAAEADIQNLPEDTQAWARGQLEETERLRKELGESREATPADTSQPTQGDEAIHRYVVSKGLDPNDPRVTQLYSLLDDTQQGAENFVYQLGQVSGRTNPVSPAFRQGVDRPPAGPAPQADAAPGRGGAVQTEEEIMDAYITRKIDLTAAREKYEAINVTPPF